MEYFVLIALFVILFLVVGFVGNRISDKISDFFRNKDVRKQNEQKPAEPEKLADRIEKGGKL